MDSERQVTQQGAEDERRWTKNGALLCRAHSRSGELCKRPAVQGTVVCDRHGGKAPQVQRKARLRLIELIDPAIATLAREMAQADKSADKQRAANSILDRAGVPRTSAQVDQDTARQMLLDRIMELRGQKGLVGDETEVDSDTTDDEGDSDDA